MHRLTVQYAQPADPAAFEKEYADVHVPLVRALPGLARFTLSRPRSLGPAEAPAPFLVAEMWFDDAHSLKAALHSPQMAAAAKHAASLGVPATMFSAEVLEA